MLQGKLQDIRGMWYNGHMTTEEFNVKEEEIVLKIKEENSKKVTPTFECPRENKLLLICKPEQAGKTFEMLSKIIMSYKNHKHMSIIFCDNSLLQTQQTYNRASEKDNLGQICQISSGGGADVSDVLGLIGFYTLTKFSTIVCCANNTQFENIFNFMEIAQKKFQDLQFEIYIDEATKVAISKKKVSMIRKWQQKLKNLTKIYLMDATPQDSSNNRGLFSAYGDLHLAPSCVEGGNITSPDYIGCKDFTWITLDIYAKDNVSYAEQVLSANPLSSGDYAFIPAEMKIKTHHSMKDMLIEKHNCVVCVLNGDFKGIFYQLIDNGVVTEIKKQFKINKEDKKEQNNINDMIKDAYFVAKKNKKPLVVTGCLVPSRGLTLQMPGLIFTHGIFGPKTATNQIEKSQKVGRLKGNWRNCGWRSPLVFSSNYFRKCCEIQEATSYMLMHRASEGNMGNETMITKSEVSKFQNNMNPLYKPSKEAKDIGIKTFDTFDDMKNWWKNNKNKLFEVVIAATGPRKGSPNDKGFYISPLGKDKNRKNPATFERVKKYKSWNLDGSQNKKRTTWKKQPFYTDPENPDTLKWCITYIKKV